MAFAYIDTQDLSEVVVEQFYACKDHAIQHNFALDCSYCLRWKVLCDLLLDPVSK